MLVYVVNPRRAGTKVALYSEKGCEAEDCTPSPPGPPLGTIGARTRAALTFLERLAVPRLDAVVACGGLVRSVPAGTVRVTPGMEKDAREGYQGHHVSNLGCLIASAVAASFDVPAFIVDPPSVDERILVARCSGLPHLPRQPLPHVLVLRAAARRAAAQLGLGFKIGRFVVACLDHRFSIAALAGGRILDATTSDCGGPFSLTQAGSLPTQGLIDLCFSGAYSLHELHHLTQREGGLLAHLDMASAREIEDRIADGDLAARDVYETMAYQVSREIGAMATVLNGRLDAIVLHGELAHSDLFCGLIRARARFLAPLLRIADALEMDALAAGAFRVLHGEEEVVKYPFEIVCSPDHTS